MAQPSACSALSGVFRRNGDFLDKGNAEILPDGGPWRLPGIELLQSSTLMDWGYKATVGYLVSNRQPERLHARRAKGRYPLIWAKAITPEGRFDFYRGVAFKGASWVDAPEDAAYVVRTPCVAVQRTSSGGQKRRINAAPVSKRFIRDHGGVVVENHVILLVPVSADAAPPEALAEALNTAAPSSELDRVCGSASISVRLLESIELGCRPAAPAASRNGRERAGPERAVAVAY